MLFAKFICKNKINVLLEKMLKKLLEKHTSRIRNSGVVLLQIP